MGEVESTHSSPFPSRNFPSLLVPSSVCLSVCRSNLRFLLSFSQNTGDAAVTENGKKSGEGGAGGNENSVVVLKVDLHCRGCVSKILKCVRGFEGNDRNDAKENQ